MDAPPVQYVKTSDGYDIAYTVSGPSEATPFVFMPSGVSHVQSSWTLGNLAEWLELLSQRFRLIHYDSRGQGLSSRGLSPDFSFDDYQIDLDAIVEHLALDRFILLASNQFSHIAVRFAAKHPERVLALVMIHASISLQAYPIPLWRDVARDNWDFFLQTIALGPSATPDPRLIERFRQMTTQADWLRAVEAFADSDVSDVLPRLRTPCLVLHAREFPHVKLLEATRLAARIPGARLCTTDGSAAFTDPHQGLAAIDAFVAGLPGPGERPAKPGAPGGLSEREREVLRLLAQGRSNPEIAKALFISRNTVQNHVSSILIKTNLQNRAQAAVYAKEHGLV